MQPISYNSPSLRHNRSINFEPIPTPRFLLIATGVNSVPGVHHVLPLWFLIWISSTGTPH